jgi:subtilisin family serine protease
MKKHVYILIILLLYLPINLFSQNNSWIEDELILSLKENLINLNSEKTFFTLQDIKAEKIIMSEKLNTYLGKNEVSTLQLHPSFKRLKEYKEDNNYKGNTVKNIADRVFVKIKFTNKIDIATTIEELKEIEGVYDVSPNYIQTMDNVPNDYYLNYHPGSSYGYNWGFHNWSLPSNDINMETAWNIQTGSPNIKVAVIDNGIDYTNPDLGSYYGANYKVAGGYNFISPSLPPLPDPQEEKANHGTKVAGVIGGLNNNKNFGLNFPSDKDGGISGIAGGWSYNQSTGTGNMGVKLLAYRTPLTSWGNYLATWQSRIDGADIINYSRSGESIPLNVVQVIWDAYELDGILYCSSMGNTQDWQTTPIIQGYPAALNDIVVGVGAVNQSYNRITFANTSNLWESAYGSHIDLMAPGISHYSTDLNNQFSSFSGTSESSPMVAGASALLKSQNSNLKARDIEQILKLTATDIVNDPGGGTSVGWDSRTGYGVINVGKALQLITSPNTLNFYTVSGGTSIGTYQHSWSYMVSFVTYPTAIRHEVRRSVTFSKNYIEPPKVWGRQGLDGTVGASPSNPNYEIMWCDVVPGSITTNGCELVTYVYKIFDGYSWFWYPCQPNEVVYSYAVAGKPVTAPVISSLTQSPAPIC